MLPRHPAKNLLALQQGQRAEIPSIEHEDIEGVENRLTMAAQQFVKLRPASSIEHHDFTVQDGFMVQAQEGVTEGTEALVDVPTPGDQTAVVGCDVGQGTETIVLQFVDEAGIVERFSALDWIGGAERGQSDFSLPGPTEGNECRKAIQLVEPILGQPDSYRIIRPVKREKLLA
jgi:hypothetical protein